MVAFDWKNYFETNYKDITGALAKLWNVRIFGTTSAGAVAEIEVNTDGALVTGAKNDSYTLGYAGGKLTTITRASDSKVITLGYTIDDLTSISDWV